MDKLKIIEVKESVFADNDREAARVREALKQKGLDQGATEADRETIAIYDLLMKGKPEGIKGAEVAKWFYEKSCAHPEILYEYREIFSFS